MFIKKILVVILLLVMPLAGWGEIIKVLDIPTALTILRGYYDIEFNAYGGGGLQTKVAIGLTDRIMLGISEDVGGAIGNHKSDWNIPGVLAKINILYPDMDTMGLAIGYDALLSGEYGKAYNNQITDEIVYGAYLAISKSVMLFQGEQFFHLGTRFPLLPYEARIKGKNISMYAGLNIFFSPDIMIAGELENIYFSGGRGKEILYNTGLKYNFTEALSITLNFQYTPSREINPMDRVSRSLLLEYQNIFY
ncbi:MAG: hypothetical protein JW827_06545 [Spirochaetes bacterium]|nr:hypothetical protein [Spirochaetota bacterium]